MRVSGAYVADAAMAGDDPAADLSSSSSSEDEDSGSSDNNDINDINEGWSRSSSRRSSQSSGGSGSGGGSSGGGSNSSSSSRRTTPGSSRATATPRTIDATAAAKPASAPAGAAATGWTSRDAHLGFLAPPPSRALTTTSAMSTNTSRWGDGHIYTCRWVKDIDTGEQCGQVFYHKRDFIRHNADPAAHVIDEARERSGAVQQKMVPPSCKFCGTSLDPSFIKKANRKVRQIDVSMGRYYNVVCPTCHRVCEGCVPMSYWNKIEVIWRLQAERRARVLARRRRDSVQEKYFRGKRVPGQLPKVGKKKNKQRKYVPMIPHQRLMTPPAKWTRDPVVVGRPRSPPAFV